MESYTQETNFFGKTNPEALAQKYGTPLYVYNEKKMRKQMRDVRDLLPHHRYTANYSIKTNSNLSILKIALEEGINADAMSPGEIFFLKKVGFPAEKIFYVSNNVSAEELQYAINEGVVISIDSISQLKLFGQINPGGRLSLRINPGIGAGHHEKVITAGKNTKFAVCLSEIPEALKVAKEYDLHIVGLNQHVGSLFMDPEPFLNAVKAFLDSVKYFDEVEFVDFGGGFGTSYKKLEGEQPFDIKAFSEQLEIIIDEWQKETGRDVLFKSEPGRYCVAESSVLLGRIHSVKKNYDREFVGTDIGMNVLMRPVLYDSWHDIEIYRDGAPVLSGPKGVYTVVGNVCETGDILAKNRELFTPKENDICCVLDAGAYGYSMCSNYNNRLRPAEVMIDLNGEDHLIRRRDTLEDLLRNFDF
ncbi:MAG TPA: diaminopimelate decarboxylase [Bacillota bacterium]|nr:diaminopimelate decarboxylase [Bacillota bacterium]HPE39094.1 diaminopimelate decarboxylase [Bacillota bacterium]